jgi:hypothetical protein
MDGRVNEPYVKDTLKPLGFSGFYFFNLGDHARLFWDQAAVVLLFLCSLLLILRMPREWEKCRTVFFAFQKELKENYLRDILRNRGLKIFILLLPGMRLAACAALLLLLLGQGLSICLPWQDLASLNIVDGDVFCQKILRLRYCETTSWFLFGGALACSAGAGFRNLPGLRPCP